LINFAFDLDFEKYIDDFEVRQALAIMKERVIEIKQDEEWKENIANEWNQIAQEEEKENKGQEDRNDDNMSQMSRCNKKNYH
jgi:hypothetical protein